MYRNIESLVEHIRTKHLARMDADGLEEQENKSGSTSLATRLPYGIAKDYGIDTTGMTPKEVWDALEKVGVNAGKTMQEKIESPGGKINASVSTSGVDNCKTFSDVKKYMSKNHGIDISDKVEKVGVDSLKKVCTTIDGVVSKYPELKGFVKSIDYKMPDISSIACYDYGNQTIGININPFGHKSFGDAATKLEGKTCYEPSVEAVIAHEMGHAIEDYICKHIGKYDKNKFVPGTNNFSPWGDNYKTTEHEAMKEHLEAKKIVKDAIKEVKKTKYGKGKAQHELKATVSEYGLENDSELLAEAFADYFQNGEKANPLSSIIVRLATERLKECSGESA